MRARAPGAGDIAPPERIGALLCRPMRIDADTVVAGVPALHLRELFCRWSPEAPEATIAARLGLLPEQAGKVLRALVAEGFITKKARGSSARELTIKGAALAQASAAPPLHRATVEAKLRELIARMVHVNASDDFLFGVEAAFVYGSYLRDTERLGDLDVSVTLFRKEPDSSRYQEAAQRLVRASGRRFNRFLDRICWPQVHVLQHLKQRSRVFSLHQDEPLLDDPKVPRRPIFLRRAPVGAAET